MNNKFLIVTEANDKIASGHLLECLECAHELIERGHEVTLCINSDMAQPLKDRVDVPCLIYKANIQQEPEFLLKLFAENDYDCLLFNLRELHNELLETIREKAPKIVIVDELGHRKLEPDVIINPMVGSEYWEYDTSATTYFGHQYLVLGKTLADSVNHDREASEEIREITILMGGVDPHETTLRLLEWMKDYDVRINCIVGGGFKRPELVTPLAKACKDCRLYSNLKLSEVYDLMNSADLAIAAGGNTLHELTTLGTPTLVIPSVPHEVDNGHCFEKLGSAITLPITTEITREEFEAGYRQISDRNLRNKMIKDGQNSADGLGYVRVTDILENV